MTNQNIKSFWKIIRKQNGNKTTDLSEEYTMQGMITYKDKNRQEKRLLFFRYEIQ